MPAAANFPASSSRKSLNAWLLVVACLIGLLGFEFIVLPTFRRQDPSLEPAISLTKFWEEKQRLIDQGLMVYHDSAYLPLFGDKSWAERMVQATQGHHKPLFEDGHSLALLALPGLTNHNFSKEADRADVWRDWWQKHASQTQEEWIQAGFKKHGFEIANPPTPEDWPKLLALLGATAGPSSRFSRTTEEFYPSYLRYNALRFLRDSGFDPLHYLAEHSPRHLSGEVSGGLVAYAKGDELLESLITPLPGRLAFADHVWSGGQALDGGVHLYLLGKDEVRLMIRIVLGLLLLVGLSNLFKHRRRQGSSLPKQYGRFGRALGWMMIFAGTLGAGGYWFLVRPWLQGKAPEYAQHLSTQGFWEAKQVHLKWGPWWHEDGNTVGAFGHKEWAARLIQWMADGRTIESCSSGHWEEALPMITNQEHAFTDSGKAWQEWWRTNGQLTQEEWIRDGFKQVGFDVQLPHSKGDWPALLAILGRSPGPTPADSGGMGRRQSHTFPYHVRYNAYRWLRDSGFEPVFYVLANQYDISGEELSGAYGFGEMAKDMSQLFEAPPPGRLAFAPEPEWGFTGSLRLHPGLSTAFQAGWTAVCAVLCLISGWLAWKRRKTATEATAA